MFVSCDRIFSFRWVAHVRQPTQRQNLVLRPFEHYYAMRRICFYAPSCSYPSLKFRIVDSFQVMSFSLSGKRKFITLHGYSYLKILQTFMRFISCSCLFFFFANRPVDWKCFSDALCNACTRGFFFSRYFVLWSQNFVRDCEFVVMVNISSAKWCLLIQPLISSL